MFHLNWPVAKQPFVVTLSHLLQSSSFILWACTVEGMKKASTLKDSTCVILLAMTFCRTRILVFVVSPSSPLLEAMKIFSFDQVPNHQELGVNLETAAFELGTVLLIMKMRFFITLDCIICVNCSPCRFCESSYCHPKPYTLNPRPALRSGCVRPSSCKICSFFT